MTRKWKTRRDLNNRNLRHTIPCDMVDRSGGSGGSPGSPSSKLSLDLLEIN